MQLTVLLAFAIILSVGVPERIFFEEIPLPALLASVAAYWLITAGAAWLSSRGGLRRLAREEALDEAVRRHRMAMTGLQVWMLAGFGVLLVGGLARATYDVPHLVQIPLACEALEMSVFFVACLIYWRVSFEFERALRWQVEQSLMLAGQPVRPGWNASQHLGYNIRHNFLFVAVPLGLILLVRDLVDLLGPRLFSPSTQGWATTAIMIAAVGVVYVVSPVLLVRVWRTRQLPAGELRGRLEQLCRKIPLHYRDILIWETGGVIANAGVMGLHRSMRYVLISDALLEQMDDRQIVAVFGHEAGHVVHHHMGYFLVFAVSTMMLSTVIVGELTSLFALSDSVAQAVMLGIILLTWGFGFGWLSRRFERQADVFGAWCAGLDAAAYGYANAPAEKSDLLAGTPMFVLALENVGRLNGLPRNARNWRHGSIASRVAFLGSWAAEGFTRRQFDRTMSKLKWLLWAALLIGAASMAFTWRHWT